MLKQITLPLTLLLLLSACGSRTNLPSSVSYSRMSAQSSTSSQSSSRVSTLTSSRADSTASVGSRLSARQAGMQDADSGYTSNVERTVAREAQLDKGSMVKDSASDNPDLHSTRSTGCGANASYDESLLCNGASDQ